MKVSFAYRAYSTVELPDDVGTSPEAVEAWLKEHPEAYQKIYDATETCVDDVFENLEVIGIDDEAGTIWEGYFDDVLNGGVYVTMSVE